MKINKIVYMSIYLIRGQKNEKAEVKRNIYKKCQKLKMKELTLKVSIKCQEEKIFLKTYLVNTATIKFKNIKGSSRLERYFNGLENLSLFQRAWVQFPISL